MLDVCVGGSEPDGGASDAAPKRGAPCSSPATPAVCRTLLSLRAFPESGLSRPFTVRAQVIRAARRKRRMLRRFRTPSGTGNSSGSRGLSRRNGARRTFSVRCVCSLCIAELPTNSIWSDVWAGRKVWGV